MKVHRRGKIDPSYEICKGVSVLLSFFVVSDERPNFGPSVFDYLQSFF